MGEENIASPGYGCSTALAEAPMPNQFRVRIADSDFHREALRDVDPVNAFLDQRQPFDDAPTFGRTPEPTESTTPLKVGCGWSSR